MLSLQYKLLAFLLLLALNSQAQLSENIRLNQIGFYVGAEKKAVLVDNNTASTFDIKTSDGTSTVYSGTLSSTGTWTASGEDCQVANFTDFNIEGEFIVSIPGEGDSHPFIIATNTFQEAARKAWRYYYYHRNTQAIEEPYAEGWTRNLGHPDDNVLVHYSANSSLTSINSPNGWYDAGDYGKYMMTATISTYSLLSALEQFPTVSYDLDLNIPESNNSLPDVIDELLWQLEWMQTMQDPNDGGVFHKLTTMGFAGAVMPDAATGQRYVCGKNTNVTLGLAATFAAAYRILEPYDGQLGTLRAELLAQAENAWDWAVANPSTIAEQCPGFNTGAYYDANIDDEWAWAAAEMYLATADITYYNAERTNITSNGFFEPAWGESGGAVRPLGTFSLLMNASELTGNALTDLPLIEGNLKAAADEFANHVVSSPYQIAMGGGTTGFVWGSNGTVGNQAFLLMTAYNYFGDNDYLYAALSNVDYLFGRNATGYCMFSGEGDKRVLDPHDRISYVDGITPPLPGMVAGGPQSSANPDPCTYPSEFPAKKFVDDWCSYSTNEITVNWNAPFAFALVGAEALFGKACSNIDLGDDLSLCNETLPLTLNSNLSGGSFTWYKDGYVIPLATDSAYTLTAVSDAGTYRIERDSAGCIKTDVVEILSSLITPDLGPDIALPTGTTTLYANDMNINTTYQWYVDGVLQTGEEGDSLNISNCGNEFAVKVNSLSCPSVNDTIWVACDQTPYSGTPILIPGRVEAEDYDIQFITDSAFYDTGGANEGGAYRTDAVDIENTTDVGGGYNVGYTAAGEYLEYTVEVTQYGLYDFTVRAANGLGDAGELHIEFDNIDVTGPISITGTSGWQTWEDFTAEDILLLPGVYVMKIVIDQPNANINYVDVIAQELPCADKGFTYVTSSTSGNISSCEHNGWTHYYTDDNPNEIIFSIDKNGNSISCDVSIDLANALQFKETPGANITYLLRRSWSVESTGVITNPVSVRFYFPQSELDEINNAAIASGYGFGTGYVWFKSNDGTPFNPITAYASTGLDFITVYAINDAAVQSQNGINYVQLDGLSGFSGGTVALSSDVVLPVTFSEIAIEDHKLLWSFSEIEDLAQINIQGSYDGIHFEDIQNISAHGYDYSTDISKIEYHYIRIEAKNTNGNITLSDIITVTNNRSSSIEVFPNPFENVINIFQSGTDEVLYQIFSTSGELLEETISSDSSISIGTSLSSGIYILKVTDTNSSTVLKINKI